MLLDLKNKDNMDLDFTLLSNLTYSILNMKVNEMSEKSEEEPGEEINLVDEEEFAFLSNELTVLEEQLEEEEEAKEEAGKSKNDQQFLINQLSSLLDKIQKMV